MSLILELYMMEFTVHSAERWIEDWPWEHFTKGESIEQFNFVHLNNNESILASQWIRMLHKEIHVDTAMRYLKFKWGSVAPASTLKMWRRTVESAFNPTSAAKRLDAMMEECRGQEYALT